MHIRSLDFIQKPTIRYILLLQNSNFYNACKWSAKAVWNWNFQTLAIKNFCLWFEGENLLQDLELGVVSRGQNSKNIKGYYNIVFTTLVIIFCSARFRHWTIILLAYTIVLTILSRAVCLWLALLDMIWCGRQCNGEGLQS